MAYTTPPQFTNGSVLSAAQMNILSDNQEHLKGVIDSPNAAVPSQTMTPSGTSLFYNGNFAHDKLVFSYIVSGIDTDPAENLFAHIYDDGGSWKRIYTHNMGTADNDTVINEYWSYSAQTTTGSAKAYGEGTAHNWVAENITLTTGNYYQIRFTFQFGDANELKVRYLKNSTGTAI